MSRDDGIKLIAIYHFVIAGLILLGTLFILAIPLFAVVASPADPRGAFVALLVMGSIFLVLVLLAILYIATGVGLWRRQEWARWVTIVLAVLGLFNVPIGTVIGLFILWFLLRDDVQAEFRASDRRDDGRYHAAHDLRSQPRPEERDKPRDEPGPRHE